MDLGVSVKIVSVEEFMNLREKREAQRSWRRAGNGTNEVLMNEILKKCLIKNKYGFRPQIMHIL